MAENRDYKIVIRGLDEMRRELRRIDPRLAKMLHAANKLVSQRVVDDARPRIIALPSPGGHKAAPGLRPRATQTAARVVMLKSNPTIHASVYGTLSHTVFGRSRPGRGPWLPWIGNQFTGVMWDPSELHGLGPAIVHVVDGFALDEYANSVMDALAAAFPD